MPNAAPGRAHGARTLQSPRAGIITRIYRSMRLKNIRNAAQV